MKNVSRIKLINHKRTKQIARETIAVENYNPESRLSSRMTLISRLGDYSLSYLDKKIKAGENLTFEEAFCGMCYVLIATNNRLNAIFGRMIARVAGRKFCGQTAIAAGSSFLQLFAMKEALGIITPDEVAGLVAATQFDLIVQLDFDNVIETCGMGGDNGFSKYGGVKTINASTLSAIVLSSLGLPCVKHGSYGNTSVVGSTETIEMFGANTAYESVGQIRKIIARSGFCYFDAHWCKTIHDLSHLLMLETINHVIGPMTPPISVGSTIHKLTGVNSKIHPEVITKAYTILHRKKIQRVGGVITIAGLDREWKNTDPDNYHAVRQHTILDEVSPYGSVASVALRSDFLGNFFITPKDFGIEIDDEAIKVFNHPDAVMNANLGALSGKYGSLADYLAMNAALAMFASTHLNTKKDAVTKHGLNSKYLKACFGKCRETIRSGKAMKTLKLFVAATGGNPSFV